MLYIVSLFTPFLHLGFVIIVAVVEATTRKFAEVNPRLMSRFRAPEIHMADEANDLGYDSADLKDHANTVR